MSSFSDSSLLCKSAEFGEFSAVTVSSSSFLRSDENDKGLYVELAFCNPRMALIAASVLLYISRFSSPRVEEVSAEILGEWF